MHKRLFRIVSSRIFTEREFLKLFTFISKSNTRSMRSFDRNAEVIISSSDDDDHNNKLLVTNSGTENSVQRREIICSDSIVWMNEMNSTFPAGYCGFTSLPDISELQTMFGERYEEYKLWFVDTAALFMSKLPVGSYVIFLQSDVRVTKQNAVCQWIDKSHLCSLAADRSDCTLVWHKLVSVNDNMTRRSAGRPTYSHLLCYYKKPPSVTHNETPTYRPAYFAIPDIFYRGEMIWSKGIGLDCCYAGVAFLKEVAKATCIVDPFAGHGTVLALANALGVDALGIELSEKRCRKARQLDLSDKLHLVSKYIKRISLEIVEERELEKKQKYQSRLEKQQQQEESTNNETIS